MVGQSIVIALSLCVSAQVAQAQPAEGDGVRGQDREARRQERRARWEAYRQASPEERRRMRVNRWVRMTTRTYELDETQQVTVRGEIEAMQQERRAAMGADAEEYDRLRGAMFELWSKRRAENPEEGQAHGPSWRRMRNNPEFQKLREQMRKLDEKYPYNWRASVERIEKLLPEEQVKKGRARWQQRRESWRGRARNRGERGGERDRRRRSGQERTGGAGDSRGTEAQLKAAEKQAAQQHKAEVEAQKKLSDKVAQERRKQAETLHPWEKYVQAFIKRYALTPAQANAAMSVLKELRTRAARIEAANADKIAAAERIEDPAARKARLEELSKPVEDLFKELKWRLDGLLTASQRANGREI